MIKFLGHASIYIKTDTTSLVTDPWFSKNGIFLNSWFQFPDNTDIDLSWKDELDYVCIRIKGFKIYSRKIYQEI